MKRHIILGTSLLVLNLIAALSAGAAVNDAIAFYGSITDASGRTPKSITLDFKLYDRPEGGTLLWARRIMVAPHATTGGGFYVDLSDTAGQRYSPASWEKYEQRSLSAALALHASLTNGPVWISYAPIDVETQNNHPPREQLAFQPYAMRATSAKVVDSALITDLEIEGEVTVAGGFSAKTIEVADIKLLNGGSVSVSTDGPGKVFPLGTNTTIKSITGIRRRYVTDNTTRLPHPAACDCGRIIEYKTGVGKENGGDWTCASLFYAAGESTSTDDLAPFKDWRICYEWSFGGPELDD